jgi:hypothetical protein
VSATARTARGTISRKTSRLMLYECRARRPEFPAVSRRDRPLEFISKSGVYFMA